MFILNNCICCPAGARRGETACGETTGVVLRVMDYPGVLPGWRTSGMAYFQDAILNAFEFNGTLSVKISVGYLNACMFVDNRRQAGTITAGHVCNG